MRKLLWWHVAVVVTAVVLAAVVVIERPTQTALIGGIGSLAAFVVVWQVFARAAARVGGWYSFALVALVVVTCGVACGFDPFLASLQCVAYPIVWYFAGGMRGALIGNVALVAAVGVGFLVSLGTTRDDLIQTAITCALSLGLSLGLGLWFSRVYDTINERQLLIDQLEAAQQQLSALSRDAGAASERERLARELHDTIAQDLTGLVLTAQRGLRELRDGNPTAAETQLAILEENARNALAETRALVASGAAVGVDGGGLATALRRLGERFQRETGIVVTVAADDSAELDRDSEVVLLRCAQEALANVRKHSGAAAASLSLSANDGTISLRVTDDGAGFDPAAPSHGFGLEGMRERLGFVAGALSVSSRPGGGTTLTATLPRIEVELSRLEPRATEVTA
jgi:signal transduction histidine kinase